MRMRKEMSAYRRESHFAHGKSRCQTICCQIMQIEPTREKRKEEGELPWPLGRSEENCNHFLLKNL
jgi:hypothetical protein